MAAIFAIEATRLVASELTFGKFKPMQINELVFVGVKSHVLAIHKRSGDEVWSCKLKGGLSSGSYFVTLLVKGNHVYAHTCGELFCLDALSGRIVWQNELSGMGYGLASIAMEGLSISPTMAQQQADDESSSTSQNSIHSNH